MVTEPPPRIPCVGAIVHDQDGRLLLVRRANPPSAGTWSLPGGRVEPGEDDQAAVVREMAEETGLVVRPGPVVGVVERPGPAGVIYVITDFACAVTGGELRPGDDASAVAWFSSADLVLTPTAPGLLEALRTWGVLPAPGMP